MTINSDLKLYLYKVLKNIYELFSENAPEKLFVNREHIIIPEKHIKNYLIST